MRKRVRRLVTVQFLNGTTLEKEEHVPVEKDVLKAIRSQIEPSALVVDTKNAITIPFRAADAVLDRIRYIYRRPSLDDVPCQETLPLPSLDDVPCGETFKLGNQTIPQGAVVPRRVKISVLLLLESPHTDETERNLKPRYPAAGVTGGEIHRKKDKLVYLLKQIPATRFAGKTPFILANPVPHPTSCRCKPLDALLRNHLMKFALTKVDRIKEEFLRRLRDYHPVVIINACTGEGSLDGLPSPLKDKPEEDKPDPKELVRRVLWEFFDNKPVHRICCNVKSVQVKGQGRKRKVLQMQHFPPEGDAKPACYVVDFPHPRGWRHIWKDGWFLDEPT